MSMQSSRRQRVARGRRGRGKSRLYAGPVRENVPDLPISPPHCPEKSKAGCGGSCSESVPTAAGVLTGVPTGVPVGGCRVASAAAKVFSWDWEEDEEEWVLSLELLRVSVLVLVFFIFLLFASGALSTVCSRKPSRLHLLNA